MTWSSRFSFKSGPGILPVWEKYAPADEDASTNASHSEASSTNFGRSPSPMCCWAPLSTELGCSPTFGRTPSPQLVVAFGLRTVCTEASSTTSRPQVSTKVRISRQMPFSALDLPLWARLTEQELDELSESSDDSSDDENNVDLEFVHGVEVTKTFSPPRSFTTSPSSDPSCASTVCPSPTGGVLGRISMARQRWADLADAEDCELTYVGCKSTAMKFVVTTHFWADLVDSDEESFPSSAMERSRTSSLTSLRWADLVDSDDDSQ